MLTTLSIRDFVLIEQLTLELDDGLTTLTGETGAGKSILLDALGVCIGLRASPEMVRAKARQASITAVFDVPDRHPVFHELRELGIAIEDNELVLRRVIQADGRSRAFVNDGPTSASTLRRLGETMVEIQGQFDLHGLLSPSHHRTVLDTFARHDPLLNATKKTFEAWQAATHELEQAQEDLAQAQREEAFLRHAAGELEDLAPDDDEVARLETRRGLLANMAGIQEAISTAADALTGQDGVDEKLTSAYRVLERAIERGGDALKPALLGLDRAAVELNEAIAHLGTVQSELTGDPDELPKVEDRLFKYRDLARKHNVEPDSLAQLLDRFNRGLEALDDSSAHLDRLDAAVQTTAKAYDKAASALSVSRTKAAKRLDKTVKAELPVLKLERAQFQTSIQTDPAHRSAQGVDSVEFTAATNPGAPFSAIQKTASGGELSRFLLALKVALANDNPLPTLVFDEVDAGVGGATAEAVGKRLQKLADNVQVLVITHSPQVAAKGAAHLRVEKTEAKKGQMSTTVVPLTNDERRQEVARMLAGDKVTPEAEAAADSLLKGNLP